MEFKKKTDKILHYNEKEYFNFLDDHLDTASSWCGISIQIKDNKTDIDLSIFGYIEIFKSIIFEFDTGLPWIIKHYYKDMNWFPNDDENLSSLRALFKANSIPNTFKGSIIFMKDDLIMYAKDLITYPYILSYRDLDISHSLMPLVIKFTNHLTIDLISTDKTMLKLIAENISSKNFIVKEYRGTQL